MKTQTVFTLLLLFASFFNLYQAAPLEEQQEEVPIHYRDLLSAEDKAVHLIIERLVSEHFDDGKGNLVDVGTQTDEVLDSNGSVDVRTQTDEVVRSNDPVPVDTQTVEDEESKESEEVGTQTNEEIDSNDKEVVGTKTNEEVDSNDSVDVGTQTNKEELTDDKIFSKKQEANDKEDTDKSVEEEAPSDYYRESTSQVCKSVNGKMECTVKVCKWYHENDEPVCEEYKKPMPLLISPIFIF